MSTNQHPDHLPNHLRYQNGATHFSDDFGELHSVTPVNLIGPEHVAHIEIRSCYGLRLDVSAAWLTELVRKAPEALAKMGFIPPLHDAILGQGNE
jgi:hypothetical protein